MRSRIVITWPAGSIKRSRECWPVSGRFEEDCHVRRHSSRGICSITCAGDWRHIGCAPSHVHAYAERGTAFTYRTYAWAPDDAVATGDPRLDNNRFFSDQVRASVDRELPARGLEKIMYAPSDLLVHFHATITQEIEIASSNRFEHCYNCRDMIYDVGTLVIDL